MDYKVPLASVFPRIKVKKSARFPQIQSPITPASQACGSDPRQGANESGLRDRTCMQWRAGLRPLTTTIGKKNRRGQYFELCSCMISPRAISIESSFLPHQHHKCCTGNCSSKEEQRCDNHRRTHLVWRITLSLYNKNHCHLSWKILPPYFSACVPVQQPRLR